MLSHNHQNHKQWPNGAMFLTEAQVDIIKAAKIVKSHRPSTGRLCKMIVLPILFRGGKGPQILA